MTKVQTTEFANKQKIDNALLAVAAHCREQDNMDILCGATRGMWYNSDDRQRAIDAGKEIGKLDFDSFVALLQQVNDFAVSRGLTGKNGCLTERIVAVVWLDYNYYKLGLRQWKELCKLFGHNWAYYTAKVAGQDIDKDVLMYLLAGMDCQAKLRW